MNTETRNPRNAGRKRKEPKDKAKTLPICFPAVQLDFVEQNGRSKFIQRLVAQEMAKKELSNV